MVRDSSGDTRPDPDPTIATKEFVRDQVTAAVEPILEKVSGQQKAVEILAATQAKEPQASQVASDVQHLKELTKAELECMAGTFQSMAKLTSSELSGLKELFTQSVQSFRDLVEKINELNDKALKVLFDVNDKASLKAEASFRTQLEELGKRLELSTGSLTEKVTALDKRFSTREGASQGMTDTKSDSNRSLTLVVLTVGVGLAAVEIMLHFMH